MLSFLIILLGNSCKDFTDEELYQRPAWLEGKLYTQMKSRPELATYVKALSRTPYGEILDRSGYFTVFAPTDEAFGQFFNSSSLYNSLEDMPDSAIARLVEYSIIRNGWTRNQLMTLNQYGWTDPEDPQNNLPTAYKRETVYEDTVWKYTWNNDLAVNKGIYNVVPDYSKLVPIFHEEFMGIYDYTSGDYEYFFGRPFEGGQSLYFAGAKVLEAEIPAENGFIYTVDRVTQPLPSLGKVLKDNPEYSSFNSLLDEFAYLTYNKEKTEMQAGAGEGLIVDSLFQIDYPDLTFNVYEEKPRLLGTGGSNIYYLTTNYSLFAPDNQAFDKLVADYVTAPGHYPSLAAAPFTIRQIIADSHLGIRTIFPSDFANGVVNGQADTLQVGLESVDDRYYCSNGQLYSFNSAVVPRAFSSISGPVFLRPEFSSFMAATTASRVLPTLKSPNKRFTFLPVNNFICEFDSSLVVTEVEVGSYHGFSFRKFDRTQGRFTGIGREEITRMVMNQVGIGEYRGDARLEFIETLSGNYMRIFRNETGDLIASGGIPSLGYNNDSTRGVVDIKLENVGEATDNGQVFNLSGLYYDDFFGRVMETTTGGWIYPANITLYGLLSQYSYFMRMMYTTGLADESWKRLNFQKGTEQYTVFVPSDSAFTAWALKKYGITGAPGPQAFVDSLLNHTTLEQLESLVSYHLIRGHMIFTDGKKASGYYETLAKSGESTDYTVKYLKLGLTLMPDFIGIRNEKDTEMAQLNFPDVTINPNMPTTSIFRSRYNRMASFIIDTRDSSPYNYTTIATVHVIKNVLDPE